MTRGEKLKYRLRLIEITFVRNPIRAGWESKKKSISNLGFSNNVYPHQRIWLLIDVAYHSPSRQNSRNGSPCATELVSDSIRDARSLRGYNINAFFFDGVDNELLSLLIITFWILCFENIVCEILFCTINFQNLYYC